MVYHQLSYMPVIHSDSVAPDPYPTEPTLLLRDASVTRALRRVLTVAEQQGGQALFVGMGRTAKRLMGKICQQLPDDYQGQVDGWDPKSDFPSTRYRIGREEWRLKVRRKDLPRSEPPEFPAPTQRRRLVW